MRLSDHASIPSPPRIPARSTPHQGSHVPQFTSQYKPEGQIPGPCPGLTRLASPVDTGRDGLHTTLAVLKPRAWPTWHSLSEQQDKEASVPHRGLSPGGAPNHLTGTEQWSPPADLREWLWPTPASPENIRARGPGGGVVPLGGEPTVNTTGAGLLEPPARAPRCRFPPKPAEGAVRHRGRGVSIH